HRVPLVPGDLGDLPAEQAGVEGGALGEVADRNIDVCDVSVCHGVSLVLASDTGKACAGSSGDAQPVQSRSLTGDELVARGIDRHPFDAVDLRELLDPPGPRRPLEGEDSEREPGCLEVGAVG